MAATQPSTQEAAFAAGTKEVFGRDFAPSNYNNGQAPAADPDPKWSAAVDTAGQQAGLE